MVQENKVSVVFENSYELDESTSPSSHKVNADSILVHWDDRLWRYAMLGLAEGQVQPVASLFPDGWRVNPSGRADVLGYGPYDGFNARCLSYDDTLDNWNLSIQFFNHSMDASSPNPRSWHAAGSGSYDDSGIYEAPDINFEYKSSNKTAEISADFFDPKIPSQSIAYMEGNEFYVTGLITSSLPAGGPYNAFRFTACG
jgi:hypothetical protein